MMHSRYGADEYGAVSTHGLVFGASPTRLVQIMFEHILSNLATAQGCMERIRDNAPFSEVIIKLEAMRKAILLLSQLNNTLDMDRGGDIALDLKALYEYILINLTIANANNDTALVAAQTGLLNDIKSGWDGIVTDAT